MSEVFLWWLNKNGQNNKSVWKMFTHFIWNPNSSFKRKTIGMERFFKYSDWSTVVSDWAHFVSFPVADELLHVCVSEESIVWASVHLIGYHDCCSHAETNWQFVHRWESKLDAGRRDDLVTEQAISGIFHCVSCLYLLCFLVCKWLTINDSSRNWGHVVGILVDHKKK